MPEQVRLLIVLAILGLALWLGYLVFKAIVTNFVGLALIGLALLGLAGLVSHLANKA